MKNVVTVVIALITLAGVGLAQAHPHHSGEVADHIHFSIASFALVAFVLVGYLVLSRYLRGGSEKRNRKDR